MSKINPYLFVKNGKQLIKLYKELFGAILLQRLPFEREMGVNMGFPEDYNYENSTMHAELDIDGAKVMLSENTMGKTGSGNVMIDIEVDSKEKIDEIDEKLKKRNFRS